MRGQLSDGFQIKNDWCSNKVKMANLKERESNWVGSDLSTLGLSRYLHQRQQDVCVSLFPVTNVGDLDTILRILCKCT